MSNEWPAWRRSPSGEAAIFDGPEDVPPGWVKPSEWRPQDDQPETLPAEPVKRRARREVKA